jgi:hypothetical protein
MPNKYNPITKPFIMILKSFKNPNFNADLYIHSIVLFTFLTLLFVIYLMQVASDSFKSNIGDLLETSMRPQMNKIKEHPLIKNNIFGLNLKGIMNKIDVPDKYTDNNTYNIKKTLLLINIILWVFIIAVIIIFNMTSCNSQIHWKEIAIQTTITFACIGLIEFMFLKFVILKVVPIEPSYLVTNLFEKTKKKFD